MDSGLEETFFKVQGKEDRESLEIQLRYAEISIDNISKTIREDKPKTALIDALEYWRQQKILYEEKLYKSKNDDGYSK